MKGVALCEAREEVHCGLMCYIPLKQYLDVGKSLAPSNTFRHLCTFYKLTLSGEGFILEKLFLLILLVYMDWFVYVALGLGDIIIYFF